MSKLKITRICRICNAPFNPRNQNQTLCSWACRAKSKITLVTLLCRECGKKYTREPNQVKNGRKYFCSRECGFKHGKPFEKKFWAKIEKTESCWLWRGTLNNRGYGVTRFKDKSALAHRVSFEIHNKPIPKGMEVMHLCDTPPCVNPKHLKVGTHAENMADCVNKKRNPYGEKHFFAKLTEETVKEAIELRAKGFTYVELGKHFNISRHSISLAIRGQTWKHLTSL